MKPAPHFDAALSLLTNAHLLTWEMWHEDVSKRDKNDE